MLNLEENNFSLIALEFLKPKQKINFTHLNSVIMIHSDQGGKLTFRMVIYFKFWKQAGNRDSSWCSGDKNIIPCPKLIPVLELVLQITMPQTSNLRFNV